MKMSVDDFIAHQLRKSVLLHFFKTANYTLNDYSVTYLIHDSSQYNSKKKSILDAVLSQPCQQFCVTFENLGEYSNIITQTNGAMKHQYQPQIPQFNSI